MRLVLFYLSDVISASVTRRDAPTETVAVTTAAAAVAAAASTTTTIITTTATVAAVAAPADRAGKNDFLFQQRRPSCYWHVANSQALKWVETSTGERERETRRAVAVNPPPDSHSANFPRERPSRLSRPRAERSEQIHCHVLFQEGFPFQ